jgi:hypothetical protein
MFFARRIWLAPTNCGSCTELIAHMCKIITELLYRKQMGENYEIKTGK